MDHPTDDDPRLDAFRCLVRTLLAERLGDLREAPPGGQEEDHHGVLAAKRYLSTMADGGWSTPTWPVEHGGAGLSAAQRGVFEEELSAHPVPDLYPNRVGLSMAGPVIMEYGTSEQQACWLPAIRNGDEIWCQLFSEPNAGSDLASLACRAERDDGGWRVTGQKVWSSRAHYSDWGLLLARTDPSLPKHGGISAFALRMKQPGVVCRPLRQMNGDAHFNEVFLDGARVDPGEALGVPGQGWQIARTTLAFERDSSQLTKKRLTSAELLQMAAHHSLSTVQRDRLMRVWSNIRVAELTLARARTGPRNSPANSGGKLRESANVKSARALELEILGARSMLADGPWYDEFVTAPSMSIRGGTDEIQRNILAERVLGLPRETDRPTKASG